MNKLNEDIISVREWENELGYSPVHYEFSRILDACEEMRDALKASVNKFRYLQGHYPCIGEKISHVDLNCIHCFTKKCQLDIETTLNYTEGK